jgi:ADP-ribose pyrophosphatase
MALYLARGLRAGAAQPEDDEIIHMKLFPLAKAVGMVLRGTIRDAKTISGLLWLDRRWNPQKPRR